MHANGLGKAYVPAPVTEDEIDGLIDQHMRGEIEPRLVRHGADGCQGHRLESKAYAIGAYCISREPDGVPRAQWIVIDTDVQGAKHAKGLTQEQADMLAVRLFDAMQDAGLEPVLERSQSGRGWHVWSLFVCKMPGPFAHWLARLIADAVTMEAGLPAVESFPKAGDPDGLGSLVALPFTGAPGGPGGGQLVNRDGSPRAVESVKLAAIDALIRWWEAWEEMKALEARAKEQERAEILERAHWPAGDGRALVDFDAITCEDVARRLGRITRETDRSLFLDCPRHASTSEESLHVHRGGKGWWCFGCAVGGGSFTLARWLHPEGTSDREVVAPFRKASA